MKLRNRIVFIIGLLILLPQTKLSAEGVFTTRNNYVSEGISFGASAIYYFGDVENEGKPLNGGFNLKNNIGGLLTFSYNRPIANCCNLRCGLMGGVMRGNNEDMLKELDEPRDDYRKFQSVVIQPSVGVQYYPFSRAGFYLYGGVALTASIITNYEFWYYAPHAGGPSTRELLQGQTYAFLPMVQVGIGYSWQLTKSWYMSAEFMLQEGLVDRHFMNLDAYPLAPSQNSAGISLGSVGGKWVDKDGNKHTRWNDGWFQLGLTVTYTLEKCAPCRLLHSEYYF